MVNARGNRICPDLEIVHCFSERILVPDDGIASFLMYVIQMCEPCANYS